MNVQMEKEDGCKVSYKLGGIIIMLETVMQVGRWRKIYPEIR